MDHRIVPDGQLPVLGIGDAFCIEGVFSLDIRGNIQAVSDMHDGAVIDDAHLCVIDELGEHIRCGRHLIDALHDYGRIISQIIGEIGRISLVQAPSGGIAAQILKPVCQDPGELRTVPGPVHRERQSVGQVHGPFISASVLTVPHPGRTVDGAVIADDPVHPDLRPLRSLDMGRDLLTADPDRSSGSSLADPDDMEGAPSRFKGYIRVITDHSIFRSQGNRIIQHRCLAGQAPHPSCQQCP